MNTIFKTNKTSHWRFPVIILVLHVMSGFLLLIIKIMTRNLLRAKCKFILRKQCKLVLSVFTRWLRQGRKPSEEEMEEDQNTQHVSQSDQQRPLMWHTEQRMFKHCPNQITQILRCVYGSKYYSLNKYYFGIEKMG